MSEGPSIPSPALSPVPFSRPSSLIPGDKVFQVQRVLQNLLAKEEALRDKAELPQDYILPTRLRQIREKINSMREKYREIDPNRPQDQEFLTSLAEFESLIDVQKVDGALKKCNEVEASLKKYESSLEAEKVNGKAMFVLIAQGKAKAVYGRLGEDHKVTIGNQKKTEYEHVYIVALREIKVGELIHEKEVRDLISQRLKERGLHGEELDLEYEMVPDQSIMSQVPMRVKGAKGDLEHHLKDTPILFPESVDLAAQVLRGTADMHDAGFVHGDMKLDNVLVYRVKDETGNTVSYKAKITDFGKTRNMGPEEKGTYTGNPRFSCPEARLTQKGEVFSSALAMIRVLEEEVLQAKDKDMLLSLSRDKCKDTSKQAEKRRGIEKFVVMNEGCLQTESTHMRGMARMLTQRVVTPSEEKLKETEQEVHKYIDALVDELKKMHPEQGAACERLRDLLKIMTDADPDKRPTTREADLEMQEILTFLREVPTPPPLLPLEDIPKSHPLEPEPVED